MGPEWHIDQAYLNVTSYACFSRCPQTPMSVCARGICARVPRKSRASWWSQAYTYDSVSVSACLWQSVAHTHTRGESGRAQSHIWLRHAACGESVAGTLILVT